MSELPQLDGPTYGPAAGGAPRQLVILAHGVGADGQDLIGLAPALSQALPSASFISPDAPYPCDFAPFGRQWFSIGDRTTATMMPGVYASAPIFDAFITERLAAAGLAEHSLALLGFSQGTMMSLHVGLRRERQIAGILGISGRLLAPELLPAEIRTRPPVALVHGDRDPLIPVEEMKLAARGLETAGISVETHVCRGLPHGINQEAIAFGMAFLSRIFAPG
jgi:phospholipase/carboxylesterase